MKILICDKDVNYLKFLANELKRIFLEFKEMLVLISFSDADKSMSYLKEYHDVDAVFVGTLDEKFNCYEIAKQMRHTSEQMRIIIMASTAVYALKCYEIKIILKIRTG